MKLSVLERILILDSLPKENNIITLKVIRYIKEMVGFNEDELKALNFKTVEKDGKPFTTWDDAAIKERDIALGEKAIDIIADSLKKMNEQKKLTENHITLYEKVMVND